MNDCVGTLGNSGAGLIVLFTKRTYEVVSHGLSDQSA